MFEQWRVAVLFGTYLSDKNAFSSSGLSGCFARASRLLTFLNSCTSDCSVSQIILRFMFAVGGYLYAKCILLLIRLVDAAPPTLRLYNYFFLFPRRRGNTEQVSLCPQWNISGGTSPCFCRRIIEVFPF